MKYCSTNQNQKKQSGATWKMLILIFILLNSLVLKMSAQGTTVSGTVVDEKNQPLTGVNVIVKGKTTGTVTDISGKFTIAAASTDVLNFTYMGFKSEEIIVGNQTQIAVTLKEEVTQLNEVVVVGYGVQKKSDLTGAVATVSAEKLQNMPVLGIDQALQGKIAGVDISSNSGAAGSDLTIRIRGTGTINNADPIVVVDGMIFSPEILKYINSSDIENISVLKDASAAAIYGSRAANGVVVLTTKKGVAGKMTVNFNMYYGQQQIVHMLDPMSGPDFAKLMNKINNGLPNYVPYNLDSISNTNWLKAVTQVAPVQNYELSFSGGTDKSTYLFSSSYMDQDGILLNTFYKRLVSRLNSDHKIKDWLTIGENFQISYDRYRKYYEGDPFNRPLPLAGNSGYDPTVPIYNKDGSYAQNPRDSSGNPVDHVYLNNPVNTDSRFLGATYAEITFLKNFKFRSSINVDYSLNEYNKFTPYYYFNGVDENLKSTLENDYYKNFSWQFINTLTWQKTIGVHDISIMAGTEASEFQNYYTNSNAQYRLPNEDPSLQYFNYFNPNSIKTITGGADHGSMYSLLGRGNYSWNDQLLFTATIRRDGSSKFLGDNKYGVFPSLALAYKLSNLPFVKDNVPQISSLKLRLGWGKIGNSSSTNTSTPYATVATGIPYSVNGQVISGMTTLSPPNANLKWETTDQKNLGLDAALIKNKLELTADYFVRKTTDMICQVSQPGDVGIPTSVTPYQNIGTVTNKGIEVSINFRSSVDKFTYSVGGYVSHNTNIVNELKDPGTIITPKTTYETFGPLSVTTVGRPIASFYGYKVDGIFQNWQQVKSHAVFNSKTAPGDLIYEDIDGDGKITSADQTFIGSPFPKLTYGFNFEAGFMGFDMRAQFQGVYKVDILTPYKFVTYGNTGDYHIERQQDLLNYWTPTNTNTNVPRLDPNQSNQNQSNVSSWFIEDGSYLRLKNFQIGYSLPPSLIGKIGIQKLRIYVGGQNLLTFTKYKGNDPEVGLSQPNGSGNAALGTRDPLIINVDFISVPQAKTIMCGLNLTF